MLVGCASHAPHDASKMAFRGEAKAPGDPTRRIAEPASHGRNRPSGENRTDGHRLINCRLVIDVAYWPEAEVLAVSLGVRCLGTSGRTLSVDVEAAFDPQRTSEISVHDAGSNR